MTPQTLIQALEDMGAEVVPAELGGPEDVEFGDFISVRNANRNKRLPKCEANFRERMFFECFTDNEPSAQADLSRIGLE